jgi:two-component system chemotaxis sensor kinase CheA
MSPFDKSQQGEMYELFYNDSRENLLLLEKQIQNLEQDYFDKEAVTELFRILHSLKGSSGTVGLVSFEKFFHSFESLVSKIQDNRVSINKEIIDLLYESIDIIDESLKNFNGKKPFEKNIAKFTEKFENIRKLHDSGDEESQKNERIKNLFQQYGLEEINPDSINFKEKNQNFYSIDIILEDNIRLKLARILVIIKNIIKIGKIAHTLPSLKKILAGEFDGTIKILFQTNNDKEAIIKKIKESGEIKSASVEVVSNENAKAIVEKSYEIEQNKQIKKNIEYSLDITNVKVNLFSLDKLVEQFGELLIRTKQLERKLESVDDSDINDILFQMQNYMFSLQDIVLKMQLVPISTAFRIFPRMVRNLAMREEKDVEFIVREHDVKVDRKILNEVGDIINHLLRNAVSHGIEKSDIRLEIGKNKNGIIALETNIANNILSLEVSDDGKGIDPEKLRKKALEKGIYSIDQVNSLSDEEIINLIFQPNFSSLDDVDEISGRGMGLNIVRRKVISLGGSITVDTDIGLGTSFKILLPISRSLIRALLVRTGKQIFSISLDDIKGLFSTSKDEIILIDNKSFVSIPSEEDIIRLYDIGKLFQINIGEKRAELKQFNVVHIKKGDLNFGLIVDEFIKESEIVIKKISDVKEVNGISGAAILDDGTVSLIIDPFSIPILKTL